MRDTGERAWSKGRAFREEWMVWLNLEKAVKENAGLRARQAGQGPICEDPESQTTACRPLLPAERSH